MRNWTNEQKLELLLRMPWTIKSAPTDDGEIELRVSELPGSLVIGTPKELETEYWENLRATLNCLLEFKDDIPKPTALPLSRWPWETSPQPSFRVTWARATVGTAVSVGTTDDGLIAVNS